MTRVGSSQGTFSTFHVYVDPIYGDDSLAWSQNPSPTNGSGKPFQLHPSSSSIKGYLKHAPYSFLTLTGPQGAMTWLRTTSKWPTNSQGQILPWTNTTTNQTVDFIVIHCLPGLYGPKLSSALDTESGLYFNGESFPVEMLPRVSLQGTSALDTIFDARHETVNIIHFGGPGTNGNSQYQYSFVDSLTIRGARHDPGPTLLGAGILIDGNYSIDSSITNCFITDNSTGIGIQTGTISGVLHSPIIANNTIAWNQVGLWNGSATGAVSVGLSNLRVLNNIFDPSAPTGLPSGHIVPVSSFEGLDVQDRQVQGTDYNAYPWGMTLLRGNIGDGNSSPPYSWPRTKTRGSTQTYTPRVNLKDIVKPPSTYTSFSSGRQVLYINDAFRVDPNSPAICRHDFRLSPTARQQVGTNPAAPLFNPLINMGVDFGLDAAGKTIHSGLLTFGNGLTLTESPGLPLNGAEPHTIIKAWDFDCDGFDNRRVAGRRFAPSNTDHVIDIGADESQEVTISGFVTSTRIFSKPHVSRAPNTSLIGNHDVLYLFNYYQPGNLYYRPQFNFKGDVVYTTPHQRLSSQTEWYLLAHYTTTHPYDSGGTNYTSGHFDNRTLGGTILRNQRWEGSFLGKPRVPRNLACDFSPHLMLDVRRFAAPITPWPHWWGRSFRLYPPGPIYNAYSEYDDLFNPNPWFNGSTSTLNKYDNPYLYYDSGDAAKWTLVSHLHPPWAVLPNMLAPTTKEMVFYHQLKPMLVWEWAAPLTFVYSVNQYGIVQSTTSPPMTQPDFIPYLSGSEWHGLRINLELLNPNHSYWTTVGVPDNNIQTFLSVLGEGPTLFAPSSNGSLTKKNSNTKVTEDPGRSKILEHMKARLAAYRKKQGSKK